MVKQVFPVKSHPYFDKKFEIRVAFNKRSLGETAVEEGDDLTAGAGPLRGEGGVAGAVGHTGFHRPVHGVGGHIGKAGVGSAGASAVAPHELHGHLPGTGRVRGERVAAGHALLLGPAGSVGVVGAVGHVGEVLIDTAIRRPGSPPQEGDDLASGAGLVGAEGGGGGAVGDALFHGPGHGVGVVGAGSHIGEAGGGGHAAANDGGGGRGAVGIAVALEGHTAYILVDPENQRRAALVGGGLLGIGRESRLFRYIPKRGEALVIQLYAAAVVGLFAHGIQIIVGDAPGRQGAAAHDQAGDCVPTVTVASWMSR